MLSLITCPANCKNRFMQAGCQGDCKSGLANAGDTDQEGGGGVCEKNQSDLVKKKCREQAYLDPCRALNTL